MRFCALFVSTALALAQTPTIDQSIALKSVSNARISPDGRFIAYQVQEADWEENAFSTQIWVGMTATGETYQLTRSKKSSNLPEWSPDSKRLAFLSDRDGKPQIYVISPLGGEAISLTNIDTGVTSCKWSPDGQWIAFVSTGPEDKSKKERKDRYGDFEIVQGDYTMSHLWLVKAPANATEKAAPEQLTHGRDFSITSFNWSPDSKRIAFAAAQDPDLSSSGTNDIYVLRLSDKYLKKLVATTGPDTNPIWSPDGSQIAFQTANGKEFFYHLNSHIGIVGADGGPARILSEKFDEDPQLLAWGPDGIYFGAMQKTASHLYRLDPQTMAANLITGPAEAVYQGASFTKDFTAMAAIAAAPNQYAEVVHATLQPFSAKPVTRMSDQLKPFRMATREVVRWKSADGTPVEGILVKPADYDPAKKYPLLVVIHGGPTGVDRPVIAADRYYPIEKFVAKGALVLRPNYRGSAGYGEKFRSLNVRNLGLGDYADVIAGVDYLIGRGLVDRERVGAMGWSQGGYISAFITTTSDRFKAVSVGAGISDWTTYYVNTDIHPFTRQYLKATPWDDPEIYRKTSPISYVKTAKTPTLIQHGELDKRVPIPNAYELYQALRDRDVPTKLVVFKGFGHGIDKPKQQRALMEQNYEWFSQYIWGEKPVAGDGK